MVKPQSQHSGGRGVEHAGCSYAGDGEASWTAPGVSSSLAGQQVNTVCPIRGLISDSDSQSNPPLEPQEDLQTVGHQLHHSVRLGDSSRTQTHRVTLLWSLRKTSRLLATNCTIQSDKGTRFGLRSQVVPLPWMILRTSRPLATNRTTQSD
ncbi:unnamed protein product [Gadus morhua 'NCC']